MASINTKQIKIWKLAHKHLADLAAAYQRIGQPKSMTVLASEWLLSMPFPNGTNNTDYASTLILSTPIPNGTHKQLEEVKEE